ncbi:MAG: putative signal transduction protein [Acidimicrobiia bacterium]|nr:putative signal transduction protein [Acidimicrobiia bacterium]
MLALGAQPLSAMRVLALAEDPNASTAELGRVVESDPVLSLQVLRLANSAAYGLGGSVGSATRAVSLLGFTTVRALAVAAVCDLADDDSDEQRFEPGFWSHSVATAIGASVIARRTAVSPTDAFTAGLLHDLGAAVLYYRHGRAFASVRELAGGSSARLLEGEREAFGTTHPEVAADLLASVGVPASLTQAVRQHHLPLHAVTGSLAKVVAAGGALASLYEPAGAFDPGPDLAEGLAVIGLIHVSAKELLGDLHAEARLLSGALGLHEA